MLPNVYRIGLIALCALALTNVVPVESQAEALPSDAAQGDPRQDVCIALTVPPSVEVREDCTEDPPAWA